MKPRIRDVPKVEPEDDEIEAVREGTEEFAAGKFEDCETVRTRSEPRP